MLDSIFSPEFPRKSPEAMTAVDICRWQTHALTEFTLGAILHEQPNLWVDETVPSQVVRRVFEDSPVAGQVIAQAQAQAAQDAQLVQPFDGTDLAAARRFVDEALASEEI